MIDLRSDTVTKPTPGMLAAMAAAEVGDEQMREDATTNELQRRMAELLGHEAALFLPTATMANQVALRAQTKPGAVVLAEERTHILIYEWGGPAIHSGLVMHGIPAVAGRPTPEQIHADEDLGAGGIVVLENTHRHLGLGAKPKEAAFLGGSEVAMPALAATLCTLLVLLPLALIPGLGPFLFKPMFLAVAFAMVIAYIVSLTFVPTRCAAWMKSHGQKPI